MRTANSAVVGGGGSADQPLLRRIRGVARESLGFQALRPGQEEAIAAVLQGRDALAVMPTGSGKSAIYHIAGRLIPGATVVVSPLIALQRDQLRLVEEARVGAAAQANSTLSDGDRRDAMADLASGTLEFLFLAPEQFANPEVLEEVRSAGPSLFVVDEAHAVSAWGHDFRPDYLRLGAVIEALGRPRVLALTATAAPPVRGEIVAGLRMQDPHVVVRGFDRPNIQLNVAAFHDELTKRQCFLDHVTNAPKPGLVYAATRRRAEEMARALHERGVRCTHYHAGMPRKARNEAQRAFMEDDMEVIVATTAFGMGIDKPNVRFVVHYDISESLDAYYQEIGRAGRDGEAAEALLLYRPQDVGLRRFFASGGRVGAEVMEKVATTVARHQGPTDLGHLQEETGLSASRLLMVLNRLDKVGAVDLLTTGEVLATDGMDPAGAAAKASEAEESHRRVQQSRVEMMRGYAETRDCRRQFMLNYFGEGYDDPCPSCDNCRADRTIPEDESTQPFPVNSRVRHREWDDGLVVRYEGNDKVVVLFDDVGYKTLSVAAVTEGDLLTATR